MAKTKLLVVTRHSPLPENDGAGAYLFDLLSYLRQHDVEIEVAWVKAEGLFVLRGWWLVPRALARVADIRVIGSLPVGPLRFFWWGPLEAMILNAIKTALVKSRLWRDRRTSAPAASSALSVPAGPALSESEPQWSELPSRLETRYFQRRFKDFAPDAVLANYCWMTPLLPTDAPVKRLVLTHDVASQRLNLKAKTVPSLGSLDPASPEGEARLLSRATGIIAVSEDDAAVFRTMLPDHRVLVAPKAAPAQSLGSGSVAGRCLFVGGINPPNREGLAWFLAEVWPAVRAAQPDATLHVVGGIGETVAQPVPAGVVVRGRVERLELSYTEAAVVVIPLLQGTGIKIKLIEACGFGKACVTTTVGLQGLPFFREAVREANDASSFAQAIIALLGDAAQRETLGRAALDAVAAHLSPDRCYGPVLAELKAS
jgi:glycosyltransferase involved in cell wall biosynthesis